MTSPTMRVLQTYELLEEVLFKLPLKDLFVMQRVSTTWRDLIRRSEPIQKKMFLLADGPVFEPESGESYTLSGSFLFDPMMLMVCDERCHKVENECVGCTKEPRECDHYEISEHSDEDASLERASLESNAPGQLETIDCLLTISTVPSKSALVARDMFLTQPPITTFECCIPAYMSDVTRNEAGIRLGDLMDDVQRVLEQDAADCVVHDTKQECIDDQEWEMLECRFLIDDPSTVVGPESEKNRTAGSCRVCKIKNSIKAE